MPLKGTALKRWKIETRNRRRNQAVKTELKTRIRAAKAALAAADATAAESLKLAMRKLDKAATKGVIHKRNAARRKSALQRMYNKAQQQPASETDAE